MLAGHHLARRMQPQNVCVGCPADEMRRRMSLSLGLLSGSVGIDAPGAPD